MKQFTVADLAAAAVVGAAYAAMTMLLAPISYGPIQMRVSEVLCILPFFLPITTWGLFIGCALANIISAAGIWDVLFGSLATLGACLCIQMLGRNGRGAKSWLRILLAALMPVVWNGVIIGAMLMWTITDVKFPELNAAFWIIGGEVALGEAIVMFVLGVPLMRYLPQQKWFQTILSKRQKNAESD